MTNSKVEQIGHKCYIRVTPAMKKFAKRQHVRSLRRAYRQYGEVLQANRYGGGWID